MGLSGRLPRALQDGGSSPRDLLEPCGSWDRTAHIAWLCLFLALALVSRDASVCFHCYGLTRGDLNPECREALKLLKVLEYSPEFLNQRRHGVLPLEMRFLSGGGFHYRLTAAGSS